MSLVFTGVMLMPAMSAGALGDGISSAIARALGAGKRAKAHALVIPAVVISEARQELYASPAPWMSLRCCRKV